MEGVLDRGRRRWAGLPVRTRQSLLLAGAFFVATFLFSLVYVQRDDAPIHVLRSRWILEHGWFPYDEYAFDEADPYVYPPAFHLLGALAKLLTGHYTVAPAFAGGVSVFLSYRLGSLWWDRDTGFLTALAMALNPMFVLWSSRMYVGTTITAGFLLTAVLYFTYRSNGDRRYLYAAFVVGGSLSAVKTYGPAIAGIVLFHLLWTGRDDLRRTVRTAAAPLFLGVLASLPWPIRNLIRTGSPVPKVTGFRGEYAVGTTEPVVSGVHLFVPTVTEIRLFFARALGVVPPSLTTEHLGSLHPVLPWLWLALPLGILGLLAYGARRERANAFVWLWVGTFVALYVVQRFMSQGATGFKYRHFITLTPVLCLFFVHAYRDLPVAALRRRIDGVELRQVLVAVLVVGLLAQMGAAAALQTKHTQTAWPPLTDWVEDNVAEDEVIYYQAPPRNLAYRIDPSYKVITDSNKEGYVDPSADFEREITAKADWVIVNDHASDRVRSRVDGAVEAGVLEEAATIDATDTVTVGGVSLADVGRVWYVYRVVEDDPEADRRADGVVHPR